MLAQSAEVTHESGVLDDAAVVEALGQTEGESLDTFSATTSAPLGGRRRGFGERAAACLI